MEKPTTNIQNKDPHKEEWHKLYKDVEELLIKAKVYYELNQEKPSYDAAVRYANNGMKLEVAVAKLLKHCKDLEDQI